MASKLDLNLIKQKAQEIAQREKDRAEFKSGDRGPGLFLKIPKGMFEFYLAPPWNNEGKLAKELYTHFSVGPNKNVVECVQLSYPQLGLKCEVHEIIDQAKDKVNLQRQRAAFTPRVNIYLPDSDTNRANADLVKEAQQLGRLMILQLTGGAWNQVINILANPRVGDITDLHNAVPLSITKTVAGPEPRDTKYLVQALPFRGPILDDNAAIDALLTKLPDLDKIFTPPDDARKAKFHQICQDFRASVLELSSHPSLQNPSPTPPSGAPADGKSVSAVQMDAQGKPVCFSNANVYNPASAVCGSCAWEAACVTDIKAKAARGEVDEKPAKAKKAKAAK